MTVKLLINEVMTVCVLEYKSVLAGYAFYVVIQCCRTANAIQGMKSFACANVGRNFVFAAPCKARPQRFLNAYALPNNNNTR